ncbi:MAG: hypothetical protein JXB06_09905 [Spirochaetales bacterium]|nr:hypothetical protein [Spirochaetales bacterium]
MDTNPPAGSEFETSCITFPNIATNALFQQGPWAGREIDVDVPWFIRALRGAIQRIDWDTARQDVQRFLPTSEQAGLREWKTELYLYQTERLEQ